MKICTRTQETTLIVEIDGPMTGPRSVALNRVIEKARGNFAKVAVDMSRVSALDSIGVGGLLYCQQVLKNASMSFVLCAVPRHIRELFNTLGFDPLLTISETPPEL